jgi:hypothetical protein
MEMLDYLIKVQPYSLRGGKTQLAMDLGVSQVNVVLWLNGKGKPNSQNFNKIKKLYKTWGGK